MKHYIISKFRPGTPWREYLPEIEAIFARTLTIEGVHGVDIFPSCSERPNRFDLMICMDMDPAALPLYDASRTAPGKKSSAPCSKARPFLTTNKKKPEASSPSTGRGCFWLYCMLHACSPR